MAIVNRWKVVSLHRRKRTGSGGGGSVEDEQGRLWAEMQIRISTGWPYEENGSVPVRRYSIRSTCWGSRSGVRVDGL
ncbi:hypothetical protein DPMN_054208 [Dreissena polymorpha]|uniref:Uncharacterized protein n=2 Tax=Dreissena polymorpha TaxID=45954 RepID=A0A9D4CMS3_DREPO|nr:hypothetical protein DPMN_054208 [Dreissena polymorpha]